MQSSTLRKFSASCGAFVLLALLILLLPLRWLGAMLLAAAVHELCHMAAIRLCGGRIVSVRLGCFGAVIRTSPMEGARALLCSLAGPIGALTLLGASRWLPRTAICAAFQSAWNLLPIYPLDGGRALRCGARLLFLPDTAQRVCDAVQTACVAIFLFAGVYGTFKLKLGPLPIAAALLLLRKIPCKLTRKRLQ